MHSTVVNVHVYQHHVSAAFYHLSNRKFPQSIYYLGIKQTIGIMHVLNVFSATERIIDNTD